MTLNQYALPERDREAADVLDWARVEFLTPQTALARYGTVAARNFRWRSSISYLHPRVLDRFVMHKGVTGISSTAAPLPGAGTYAH
jgi:hypothetical protein